MVNPSHGQSKPWSMRILVNLNHGQSKSWSIRILVNANGRSESWSTQMVNPHHGQFNSTSTLMVIVNRNHGRSKSLSPNPCQDQIMDVCCSLSIFNKYCSRKRLLTIHSISLTQYVVTCTYDITIECPFLYHPIRQRHQMNYTRTEYVENLDIFTLFFHTNIIV